MIMIFVGALVIAGLFTFVPGRIMHAVFFGPLVGRGKSRPEAVLAGLKMRAPARPAQGVADALSP
jgi:hypothetical protein